MTVSYTAQVANSKDFGCFLKLMLKWRGGIYKLVWPDLLVFLSMFFSLSAIYRFALNADQQRTFEKIAAYCEKYVSLIPVGFVLGFFLSVVVTRWWEQYKNIPWIDTLAILVNSNVLGKDEKDRIIRRTIMRYICLSVTQCFTLISPRVKKRFPTLDHFVEAGLLLETEKVMIDEINATVALGAQYPTHFVPIVWAAGIVTRAKTENKIRNDTALTDEINRIKDQCAMLISYDWISVPLVYTQVVTLSVYVYFLSCTMSRQWMVKGPLPGEDGLDLYFPVFTVLQFFFYMGWLKTAESLVNPFGDDDNDFELNWIVDRNIQVAYLIVDEMQNQHPELLKDQFWDKVVPSELPHTVASEQFKDEPPVSSTADVLLSRDESIIMPPPSLRSGHLHGSASALQFQDGGGSPTLKHKSSIVRGRYASGHSNSVASQSVGGGGSMSGSVGEKLNRLGTAFKKLVSRESRRSNSSSHLPWDGAGGTEVFGSLMSQGQGQEAIPELDENMVTITSANKSGVLRKPTAQEVFAGMSTSTSAANPHLPTSFDSMTVKIEQPKLGNNESEKATR